MRHAVWKHFKTVCKHKAIVFKECMACGIGVQGIIHDMSKFGITEFVPSALYFQGTKSPIDAEKDAIGYSAAWLHHKGHNPHHWEYWTDFDSNGTVIAIKIPWKYVIEMVCDWIAAGKVYGKGEWSQDDPLKYFIKTRNGRYFHPETETLIVSLLEIIRDHGLIAFHDVARHDLCNLKERYDNGLL